MPNHAMEPPQEIVDPPAVSVLDSARSHLNLPYATVSGWRPLRLDLHLPAAGTGPFPVVVYAHGGSFVGGVPALGPWHTLPAQGIAVASVAYRLAGEAPFPAPVEDIRAAIRWVRASAARLRLDPDRIAGWGSSAGGYLMTMATLAGNKALGHEVGELLDVPSTVSAVVDHYGVADFTHLVADAIDPNQAAQIEAVTRQFLGGAAGPEIDPVALARDRGGPPFLIMHGDADHRVGLGQSVRLQAGLVAAGVPAELVVVPGADHAAVEFTGPELVAVAVRFLRDHWSTP